MTNKPDTQGAFEKIKAANWLLLNFYEEITRLLQDVIDKIGGRDA